jgi:hypothetical protein
MRPTPLFEIVIPAKAGIQDVLDSLLHGNDNICRYCVHDKLRGSRIC